MDTLSRKHRLRQQLLLGQQLSTGNNEINNNKCNNGTNNNKQNENPLARQEWRQWSAHQMKCHYGSEAIQQDNNGEEAEQEFGVFQVESSRLKIQKHPPNSHLLFQEHQHQQQHPLAHPTQPLATNHYENLQELQIHPQQDLASSNRKYQTRLFVSAPRNPPEESADCSRANKRLLYNQQLHKFAPTNARDQESLEADKPVEKQTSSRIQSSSDCSTSSSTKSSVDSSGFVSSSPMQAKRESRLMTELDLKLARELEIDDRAPSRMSAATESTLTRAGDFCYSILCRDDFSSFIPGGEDSNIVEVKSEQVDSTQGPFLVGLHNESAPLTSRLSPSLEGDSQTEAASSSLNQSLLLNSGESDHLSKMLDLHMARMDSLLRLMAGDRGVSLDEAFGDEHIPVSEQNKTHIEFKALNQKPDLKVTQEFQVVEMDLDEDWPNTNSIHEPFIWTNIVCSEFRSICNSELPVPSLDLLKSKSNLAQHHQRIQIDRKKVLAKLMKQFVSLGLNPRSGSPEARLETQVQEFLDAYQQYQCCLRETTSFATDWRHNWLFAHKRPMRSELDEFQPNLARFKRARLSSPARETEARLEPNLDLYAYSTLILSNPAPLPVRLAYLVDDSEAAAETEALYADREEEESELKSLNSPSNAIDLCDLLLRGTFAEPEDSSSLQPINQKRLIKVMYWTSYTPARVSLARFHFSAFGHLFEAPLNMMKVGSRRHQKLKRYILSKLRQQIEINRNNLEEVSCPSPNRVRFVVELSANVELVNKMSVIQFCARISGSLPIYVRWYRDESEISKSIESRQAQIDWPLGMQAVYEFSYQTDWSSWYRFRRDQANIMFEIKDAHLQMDYNQTYRCVIENSHSRCESSFTLTSREPTKLKSRLNDSRKSRKALLLRTWSQRTLHRPIPMEAKSTRDEKQSEMNQSKPSTSRTQSVGRLSSCVSTNSVGHFGKDFPYHPENLAKRLHENKFSSPTLLRRHHQSLDTPSSSDTLEIAADLESDTLDQLCKPLQGQVDDTQHQHQHNHHHHQQQPEQEGSRQEVKACATSVCGPVPKVRLAKSVQVTEHRIEPPVVGVCPSSSNQHPSVGHKSLHKLLVSPECIRKPSHFGSRAEQPVSSQTPNQLDKEQANVTIREELSGKAIVEPLVGKPENQLQFFIGRNTVNQQSPDTIEESTAPQLPSVRTSVKSLISRFSAG